MTILRASTSWSRPRPTRGRVAADLTPDEQAALKRALATLRRRAGSWSKLAAELGLLATGLKGSAARAGHPGAGLALRAARLAGVSVEDIIAGRWPAEGACPHCGHAP